jgi:hypothetical protein
MAIPRKVTHLTCCAVVRLCCCATVLLYCYLSMLYCYVLLLFCCLASLLVLRFAASCCAAVPLFCCELLYAHMNDVGLTPLPLQRSPVGEVEVTVVGVPPSLTLGQRVTVQVVGGH